MNKTQICQKHKVALVRKPIMYGLPCSGHDYSDVILGGCCIDDDSPQFGYWCPQGQEVYFLKDGQLIADEDLAE